MLFYYKRTIKTSLSKDRLFEDIFGAFAYF